MHPPFAQSELQWPGALCLTLAPAAAQSGQGLFVLMSVYERVPPQAYSKEDFPSLALTRILLSCSREAG